MYTDIPVAPIVTNTINYYNWNISDVVNSSTALLIPSIEFQPVIVTDNPNPLNQTGTKHPEVTRTISIPPWPWTTDGTEYPTVTFSEGELGTILISYLAVIHRLTLDRHPSWPQLH